MLKRLFNILFVLFFCIWSSLNAQQNPYAFNIETNYSAAFMPPFYEAAKIMSNGRVDVGEIGFVFPLAGSSTFKTHNSDSYFGLAFNYTTFSNPERLGFGIGFLPNVDICIYSSSSLRFSFRGSFGISYINKTFDKVENLGNRVISSHGNNISDGQLRLKKSFTEKFSAQFGMGMLHYSNAAWKRPNYGINMMYLSLGAEYKFFDYKEHIKDSTMMSNDKNLFIEVQSHAGLKAGVYYSTNRFKVFGFQAQIGKKSHKHKYGLVLDVTYDEGLKYLAFNSEFEPEDPTFKFHNNFLVGAIFGFERLFGNVSFFIHSGVYLYSPYKTYTSNLDLVNNGGRLLNRLGVRYYYKNMFLSAGVKTHMGAADVMEYSIGYKIK